MANRAQQSTVPGLVRWTQIVAKVRFEKTCRRLALEFGMLEFLGEAEFESFLKYMRRQREAYVNSYFVEIWCWGNKFTGLPCPYNYRYNAHAPNGRKSQLRQLQYDHGFPMYKIVKVWKRRVEMFPKPRAWNAGINGEHLRHLLIGVGDHGEIWKANLRFRCGYTEGGAHLQCHRERA